MLWTVFVYESRGWISPFPGMTENKNSARSASLRLYREVTVALRGFKDAKEVEKRRNEYEQTSSRSPQH